ncbi:MAG: hypothetical protein U0Q22_10635 [Acidimicrobiales bacterium]
MTRRLAPVIVGLLVVGVACSSGATASSKGSTSTSLAAGTAASTAAPTTAAPTVPPTTAPPAVAAFPNPTAAGAALYRAWTTSNRVAAGALSLAPPAELDKLFAAPPRSGAKNRGCDDGDFGSANCFFANDQGGVNVVLTPGPGGWSVSTIDPFG